jgi:hypothetical protein
MARESITSTVYARLAGTNANPSQVGIPVVRGFDRDTWRRIHELPKGGGGRAAGQVPIKMTTPAEMATQPAAPGSPCAACAAETEKWRDLILVIHGIGQKFAERVESFHFTHAVNGFRRAVNAELGNNVTTRSTTGGIMVLPVNW